MPNLSQIRYVLQDGKYVPKWMINNTEPLSDAPVKGKVVFDSYDLDALDIEPQRDGLFYVIEVDGVKYSTQAVFHGFKRD